MRWGVTVLVLWAAGCAQPLGGGGAGAPCIRSLQCNGGLVCVSGVCTDDLSSIEGGIVPTMDGATPIDGGMAMVDAGNVPGMDSGPPPPPVDGGRPPPPVDAGPPPPPVDAGPPPPPDDAGP